MKLGFIGLGNLGIALAENLLVAQPLYVYNRTIAKAEALKDKGAIVCHSISELAELVDIVFTTVSDDAALKAITEGPGNIAESLKPGGIHVSISTILPETSIALAAVHQQHKNIYISCPVIGRPEMVRAKKINFLASGDSASIQTIKPLLQQTGALGVWEFGEDHGAANIAKLCSNFLILSTIEALSESINLANKSKIDTKQWLNVITNTSFNAPAYHMYSKLITEENFSPTMFSAKLGLKDMNLILQQATNAEVQMPVGKQVQSILKQTIEKGMGDDDVTSMAKLIKEM